MKELNHIFRKGILLFAKWHSDNPEGQVEVESCKLEVIFENFDLDKNFFFKKGTFNKFSDH